MPVRSPQTPSFSANSSSFQREGRRSLYYGGAGFLLLVATVTGWTRLRLELFSSNFMPHSYCYLGKAGVVWSHVITDSLIGLSYVAISVTLVRLLYKSRRNLPFDWIFLAFGLFIVACGFTHFMEVITVWVPVYVLSAVVKGLTAVASVTTAVALPFVVPQILLMVQKGRESEEYLRYLEMGLSERESEHGELKRINELLEGRVAKRTLELAQANETLKASEQQYRLLFDGNPMPMWVFDRDDLKFLAVNEAAIRHYGFSRGEFLSMTIRDIRPVEDVSKLVQSLSETSDELSDAQLWRHRKKDGTVIQVEITSHGLDLDGKDAELILAHDVTAQRTSQENLRQSEERFATAFHSSPLAITITTDEGRYLDANNAFFRLMGYTREEVLGRTSRDLKIWINLEDRNKWLQELQRSGRTQAFETRFLAKSGEERHVQVSTERIALDGNPCLLANTLDITESRRLEEQFRQAQKMEAIGRLAGGVAHDFNNLLSVIIGYSELAEGLTIPDAAIRRHIDHIRKAAERATSLTRQLLAFSRQQVLAPRVLNLNAVVHSVSQMLLRMIGEDITLNLKPAEPLGSVKADLGQVEQILMNLVLNARDAMPEGGKIVIETANVELDDTYRAQYLAVNPGSYVMLAVSDTGCGMDAKTITHIFEPFFTTKEPGKGTGLGLSTVYGIVKQSDGYVWAYSEPMQGTTFKVYLPRVDTPAEVLGTHHSDVAFELGTETVLLVEDDDFLRPLTAQLLRDAGYTVLEAENGNVAIEIARKNEGRIDVVLTDVIMPGMSGADLVVYLRHLQPKVAILFMSGYASDLVTRAGVLESEKTLLNKPFTRKSLLTKVRLTLDENARKD